VRVRPQGGREGVAALKTASADVIVLDAFLGARVPAELTTAEFLADVLRVLRPGGLFLANLADGPPLTYLRRVVATVTGVLPNVLLVSDPAVLKGRRYGNVVLAASVADLPLPAITRSAAAAMFPVQVLTANELERFVGQAKPLTDLDSQRSVAPPGDTWRAGEY
jgi:spermidine synthase